MDEEKKAKALNVLVTTDQWKYVEEIITQQLLELKSIDCLEVKGDPHGLEVEVRSRQLAAQTVRKIMAKIESYGGDGPPVTPINRSFQ